ncbi:nitrite reductase [Nocardioides caeni]|uniref:Nitrite reductase n=1 Tax=Nocardioides caeni TaxID=574700 RepID=A0A4S8NHR4_9ACTN|nr:nitrite reductase [Nocardioides caeni]THV16128.1 nitrite reductase [Nocardioides caeni]
MSTAPGIRDRADRCPGVLRPWPAEDGGLVRLRVPGGRLPLRRLRALTTVAREYGDGRVRLTGRANLQLRAMPMVDGTLASPVVAAIEAIGLLPSRAHDRVRNVLASPQTGIAGGRADLTPVVTALDTLLVTDPRLAALPGRFLFTLDDGRGDLADRHRDLGLVVLDESSAQLLVGTGFGPVVALGGAAAAIGGLARAFLAARGTGPTAAWHVPELTTPLVPPSPVAPGARVRCDPLPFGRVDGGEHVEVGEAGIDTAAVDRWEDQLGGRDGSGFVVITPWHGVLLPDSIPTRPEDR